MLCFKYEHSPLKLAIVCQVATGLSLLSGRPVAVQLLLQRPAVEAPGPQVSCVDAALGMVGNEPAQSDLHCQPSTLSHPHFFGKAVISGFLFGPVHGIGYICSLL